MSAAVLDSELVSDLSAPGDAELVERFVVARDQWAFAQLVHRHGPVVLGVCRRVLHDTHDIDDVFQAAFLVFVRDAARVRKRKSVASWLYGVAYRLALHTARQRHRRRETILVDDTCVEDSPFQRMTDRHDQQAVDAELNALPEKYRQPLVLRYLFGKSPDEIASELGITIGSVDGLLKRGKNEMRTRLLKRGISVGVALAAVQGAQQATTAAGEDALIEATIEGSLAWDLGSNTLSSDLVSDRAFELAGKEGIAMTVATKATVTVGLTLGAIVAGFGASALIGGRFGNHAEASGIVTTMPGMRAARDGTALAVLAADPNVSDDDRDSESDPAVANGQVGLGVGNLGSGSVASDGSGGSSAVNDTRNADPKSRWDFKSRNPNVVKIEKALLNPTEVNFTDISLKDALDYLKEVHQIEIWIDAKLLSEEGISVDNTVNLVVSGVSLRSVLRVLLEPLLLDYMIENEMMVVTTQSRTGTTFETRVYKTSRIPGLTPKELVEIITTSVEPDRWNAPSNDAASAGTANAQAKPGAPTAEGNAPNPSKPRLADENREPQNMSGAVGGAGGIHGGMGGAAVATLVWAAHSRQKTHW